MPTNSLIDIIKMLGGEQGLGDNFNLKSIGADGALAFHDKPLTIPQAQPQPQGAQGAQPGQTNQNFISGIGGSPDAGLGQIGQVGQAGGGGNIFEKILGGIGNFFIDPANQAILGGFTQSLAGPNNVAGGIGAQVQKMGENQIARMDLANLIKALGGGSLGSGSSGGSGNPPQADVSSLSSREVSALSPEIQVQNLQSAVGSRAQEFRNFENVARSFALFQTPTQNQRLVRDFLNAQYKNQEVRTTVTDIVRPDGRRVKVLFNARTGQEIQELGAAYISPLQGLNHQLSQETMWNNNSKRAIDISTDTLKLMLPDGLQVDPLSGKPNFLFKDAKRMLELYELLQAQQFGQDVARGWQHPDKVPARIMANPAYARAVAGQPVDQGLIDRLIGQAKADNTPGGGKKSDREDLETPLEPGVDSGFKSVRDAVNNFIDEQLVPRPANPNERSVARDIKESLDENPSVNKIRFLQGKDIVRIKSAKEATDPNKVYIWNGDHWIYNAEDDTLELVSDFLERK